MSSELRFKVWCSQLTVDALHVSTQGFSVAFGYDCSDAKSNDVSFSKNLETWLTFVLSGRDPRNAFLRAAT